MTFLENDRSKANRLRPLSQALQSFVDKTDQQLLAWLAVSPGPIAQGLAADLVGDPDAPSRLLQAGLAKSLIDDQIEIQPVLREAIVHELPASERRAMHAALAKPSMLAKLRLDDFLYHLANSGNQQVAEDWVLHNSHLVLDEAHRRLGRSEAQRSPGTERPKP
jgi:hypothetical protein